MHETSFPGILSIGFRGQKIEEERKKRRYKKICGSYTWARSTCASASPSYVYIESTAPGGLWTAQEWSHVWNAVLLPAAPDSVLCYVQLCAVKIDTHTGRVLGATRRDSCFSLAENPSFIQSSIYIYLHKIYTSSNVYTCLYIIYIHIYVCISYCRISSTFSFLLWPLSNNSVGISIYSFSRLNPPVPKKRDFFL